MSKKLNINFIFKVMILLILNVLFITTLFAQHKQEIVVTINGISTGDKIDHFNKAEELRNQMKFAEAIEEYKYVIVPGELCGKEAEAHYDIGICYTWLESSKLGLSSIWLVK